MKEDDIKYAKIGTFVDKTAFLSLLNTFINLNNYILYEKEFTSTKNEVIKSFVFQVPVNQPFFQLNQ